MAAGKAVLFFNEIKKLVESGENNIILLTPEQYSLVAERRLLMDLGEDMVNCVDNSSFSRISNDVKRNTDVILCLLYPKEARLY